MEEKGTRDMREIARDNSVQSCAGSINFLSKMAFSFEDNQLQEL